MVYHHNFFSFRLTLFAKVECYLVASSVLVVDSVVVVVLLSVLKVVHSQVRLVVVRLEVVHESSEI